MWILAWVLFPISINQYPAPLRPETREGLYKASLTRAGFGLLGIHYYESKGDAKHWNMVSKFAELHRKENIANLEEIDADFYAQKTGNTIKVHATRGTSYIDKNVVELFGDVKIHSAKGYLFEMNSLTYSGKEHQFHTNDWVEMRGPNPDKPQMTLLGQGLIAIIDEERFSLKRNVSAQKKLTGKNLIRIFSQRADFYTDEGKANFEGKVRTFLPELTLRSQELELYSSEKNEKIVARGNIYLENKDRIGRAQYTSIDLSENKIILEGNAQLKTKNNDLQGRRIILYTDEDQVEVEGAQGTTNP